MSTYRRYQDARDAAWRALLRLDVRALPVDAEACAKQLGMEILPWPDGAEARLSALVRQAGRGVCASLRIRGVWHVFLKAHLSQDQRRFAVAHELGHRLLDHGTRALAPGIRAFCSLDNEGDLMEDPDDLDDYAADIFAIRLLAPACVLHEMHADQSGRIAALCGLPPRAAALRAERMQLLNRRDAFFTHPLEKQVRDRFLPFIRAGNGFTAPVRPAQVMTPLPVPRETKEAREMQEKPPAKARLLRRALLLGGLAAAALAVFLLLLFR